VNIELIGRLGSGQVVAYLNGLKAVSAGINGHSVILEDAVAWTCCRGTNLQVCSRKMMGKSLIGHSRRRVTAACWVQHGPCGAVTTFPGCWAITAAPGGPGILTGYFAGLNWKPG